MRVDVLAGLSLGLREFDSAELELRVGCGLGVGLEPSAATRSCAPTPTGQVRALCPLDGEDAV
ncbi:hypothetical protein GCM10010289_73130 [Streptomyces violascens]|nr:hypothetical protein GCM10010289_73130 [Streptomyces violascens]